MEGRARDLDALGGRLDAFLTRHRVSNADVGGSGAGEAGHAQGDVDPPVGQAGCRITGAGERAWHAMEGESRGAPEHEQVASVEVDVGPRSPAVLGVAEPEGA